MLRCLLYVSKFTNIYADHENRPVYPIRYLTIFLMSFSFQSREAPVQLSVSRGVEQYRAA